MSALFDEVEKQARLLTAAERATLARILIEGLESEVADDVDQLWAAEAQRRFEAYRRGELKAHDGDEVMTRARNRLGGRE